jgi:hypothetical protein
VEDGASGLAGSSLNERERMDGVLGEISPYTHDENLREIADCDHYLVWRTKRPCGLLSHRSMSLLPTSRRLHVPDEGVIEFQISHTVIGRFRHRSRRGQW